MTAALLYFATAALVLWLAHRWVTPMTRTAALVLILLPLAFTGKALLTGRVYAPVDLAFGSEPLSWYRAESGVEKLQSGLLSDVFCLNIPWKYATRRAYAHGELALWSPSLFGGDILAASAQSTPYEPLFLLSLLLPMATSLTYIASMTFFLGALLMFLFLRELGLEEWPALIGAATWMYGMFLAFWLEWVITATLYWMPLVLVGVRRTVRELSLRGAALLTFAFVMMLLNGHPESALHIVFLGLPWAALELWSVRGRGFVRAAALGTSAGVVALLLCAVYLLPLIEALPHTHEHRFRETIYAHLDKSVPGDVALLRLHAQAVPFMQGWPHSEWPTTLPYAPPPESGYGGSAAVALAAFGLWRSRLRVKWVALALVVTGLVFGIELWPFADLLGKLPLFDIALNGRLIVLTILGTAILAALGASALERRGLLFTGIAASLLYALACAGAWDAMRTIGLSQTFLVRNASMLAGAPLLVSAIALLARKPRVLLPLLLVLIVAQRAAETGDLYTTVPAKAFYPRVKFFELFPKSPEPYRIVAKDMTFVPNLATMYDLEDVRGYQAMTLRRFYETERLWSVRQGAWFNRVDDLNAPFLSMMNVRFAIVPWAQPAPAGWRRVPSAERTQLFENPHVLGRAFVPRLVRVIDDSEKTVKEMESEKDFAERSWIERRGVGAHEELNGPGRTTTRQHGFGELEIRAEMERTGWVVITQTAWSGWRAFVDGKRIPIRFANHAFLGVLVPGGTHTLRLVYRPRSFEIGAIISIATIVLLMAMMIVRRWRLRALA